VNFATTNESNSTLAEVPWLSRPALRLRKLSAHPYLPLCASHRRSWQWDPSHLSGRLIRLNKRDEHCAHVVKEQWQNYLSPIPVANFSIWLNWQRSLPQPLLPRKAATVTLATKRATQSRAANHPLPRSQENQRCVLTGSTTTVGISHHQHTGYDSNVSLTAPMVP